VAIVDQFYGDSSGAVEDAAENQWWIATHKENVSGEELMKQASK
jgi:PhnB protein